jgi:hypothetical protein
MRHPSSHSSDQARRIFAGRSSEKVPPRMQSVHDCETSQTVVVADHKRRMLGGHSLQPRLHHDTACARKQTHVSFLTALLSMIYGLGWQSADQPVVCINSRCPLSTLPRDSVRLHWEDRSAAAVTTDCAVRRRSCVGSE